MATTTKPEIASSRQALHGVPLTLEGSNVLHQMFRFRWAEWRKLTDAQRRDVTAEAAQGLERMEHDGQGQSALFSLLAKGDLLLVHFRNSFDQLKQAELELARLELSDYLELTTSYLSVVELGLYESSVKLYRNLREKGIEPHTPEWDAAVEDTIKRQAEAMRPRLFPQIPASSASTPWTAVAAKIRTGTAFPLKSASVRWKSTDW
jgi:hydrogen peroxide-dependent heme synthase